ncbi:Depudecin biosynthesis cluster-specific transcription activator DEP6 [Curvularia clavata]|uniref:Depudecin biosynthesis cluster-specific transcription activator DEP6 n=1 Tax=Curvularia clavata TaxID=95742 RepID=A0A9Q8Z0U3_CURCL|nr:Depudecin biosynthesis cluster-specific transcription activator DEP6 [Curvularia clavata]
MQGLRRTRDEQVKQLQERLAKTEAQLALSTQISHPSLPSLEISENNIPRDLDNVRETNATNNAFTHDSALDPDIFTSFAEGADSNMSFSWADQPFMALEPLDNMLLNQSQPAPSNGSDEDLSPTDLPLLHSHYFELAYFSFPFINRDRFMAEKVHAHSPAISALIYAVALAGCSHSPPDHNRHLTCYKLARNYAERCEQEDCLNDLNLLQALLLIGRFEAMSRKLERSWLTLGRAAMLCKLLKLNQMDADESDQGIHNDETQSGPHVALPHTEDPVLLEERRRTFWGLYILQSYVRTRTGWEYQLEDTKNLRINLPSPGLLRSDLEPLKMPSLLGINTEPGTELSSYAGCVLMVELALRCFDNGQNRNKPGFWDDYCALVKRTDDLFKILKRHLNATSIREDPVAFSLYLNLRATEIFSHDSAIKKNDEQGLPPLMVAESQRRATAAAFQICNAVGLNLPSPRNANSDIIMLQAIFIAWPLTMALKALYRELVHEGARENMNGVVASLRLLFAALDHIEESDGHWHRSVGDVEAKLQECNDKNSFGTLAL